MGVGAGPFAPMQSVGKWAEHRTKAKPNGCGASKCEAWAADFVRHSRLALVRPFFVPRNPERSFSGRVRVWGLFAFSRCNPLKANGLHLRAREPSRLRRGKGVEQKGGLAYALREKATLAEHALPPRKIGAKMVRPDGCRCWSICPDAIGWQMGRAPDEGKPNGWGASIVCGVGGGRVRHSCHTLAAPGKCAMCGKRTSARVMLIELCRCKDTSARWV